jgi:acetyl esterase/lipase
MSAKPKYELTNDIKWASPKGHDLKMDIYTPVTGKISYPVIILFHGGWFLVNSKSIMTETSRYLVSHGDYVVCNVDYRLLSDLNNTVSINEIIEDAMGAVLWIKENIIAYKGDPSKITVTGDSAGGLLATMILTQGQNLHSGGFTGSSLGFNPSYLPKNKMAEDIAITNGMEVQAAVINYGIFDLYEQVLHGLETSNHGFWALANVRPRGLFGPSITIKDHPELYKQVSPFYTVPSSHEKKLPPILFTVGSKDNVTTPSSIETFFNKLSTKGHTNMVYWIYLGKGHAFLDGGSNPGSGHSFESDASPALDYMIAYLNKLYY